MQHCSLWCHCSPCPFWPFPLSFSYYHLFFPPPFTLCLAAALHFHLFISYLRSCSDSTSPFSLWLSLLHLSHFHPVLCLTLVFSPPPYAASLFDCNVMFRLYICTKAAKKLRGQSANILHTQTIFTYSHSDTHLITNLQTHAHKHICACSHAVCIHPGLNPAVSESSSNLWLGWGFFKSPCILKALACLGWNRNTLHLVTWR